MGRNDCLELSHAELSSPFCAAAAISSYLRPSKVVVFLTGKFTAQQFDFRPASQTALPDACRVNSNFPKIYLSIITPQRALNAYNLTFIHVYSLPHSINSSVVIVIIVSVNTKDYKIYLSYADKYSGFSLSQRSPFVFLFHRYIIRLCVNFMEKLQAQ